MKFGRIVIGILAVAVLLAALGAGAVMTSSAKRYDFLGGESPKAIFVEPVSGTSRGREARYYVLPIPFANLKTKAESALTSETGWTRTVQSDGAILFRRGRIESVTLRRADRVKDARLTASLPAKDRQSWTLVRTVDPRGRRALRRTLMNWGKAFIGY